MNPAEQAIRKQIVRDCIRELKPDVEKYPGEYTLVLECLEHYGVTLDSEYSEDLWHALSESGYLYDAEDEFRNGGQPSGLATRYDCRHYENEEHAYLLDTGEWVGFTYWYGGGKHGEPGAVEWMEGAYFLDVREETRVVSVFSKRDRTFEYTTTDEGRLDNVYETGE